MINLERMKQASEKPKRGPLVVGKKERGVDGRFYRPEYEVVGVDIERNVVQVKNGRGESQELSPENLFTWPGVTAFAEKKAWANEKAKRVMEGFIVAMAQDKVKPATAQEVIEAIEEREERDFDRKTR